MRNALVSIFLVVLAVATDWAAYRLHYTAFYVFAGFFNLAIAWLLVTHYRTKPRRRWQDGRE